MEQHEKNTVIQNGITDSLIQIKQYLETDFNNLTVQLNVKDSEIKTLKEELDKVQQLMDGNRQLVNKLLGEINKLQNDIEWYKKTYEMRSLLGTIREKLSGKKA